MSIKTIPGNRLELKIPQFLCDDMINPALADIPMLSHLNSYGFVLITGKPGSGKTSLALSLLTAKGKNRVWRKAFNHVIICFPSQSRQSLKDDPFKDHPSHKVFEDLDLEAITKIYKMLEENVAKDPKENSILLLDDVATSLKRKEIQFLFKKIIMNRRHLRCQIVCLLQSYISLPLELRKLATVACMYKPSKVESINFWNELFESKKEHMDAINRFVYKKHGDWMLLDINSQNIYKDFDRIVIDDGEEDGYESEEK
jgi:hypothetical protein